MTADGNEKDFFVGEKFEYYSIRIADGKCVVLLEVPFQMMCLQAFIKSVFLEYGKSVLGNRHERIVNRGQISGNLRAKKLFYSAKIYGDMNRVAVLAVDYS